MNVTEHLPASPTAAARTGSRWRTLGAILLFAAFLVTTLAIWSRPSQSAGITRQTSEVRTLLLACLTYAEEHGGRSPDSLRALLPDFVDSGDRLFWSHPRSSRTPSPYLYRSGFPIGSDLDATGEPFLAGPAPIEGWRAVAFITGEIRTVQEEAFQRRMAPLFRPAEGRDPGELEID